MVLDGGPKYRVRSSSLVASGANLSFWFASLGTDWRRVALRIVHGTVADPAGRSDPRNAVRVRCSGRFLARSNGGLAVDFYRAAFPDGRIGEGRPLCGIGFDDPTYRIFIVACRRMARFSSRFSGPAAIREYFYTHRPPCRDTCCASAQRDRADFLLDDENNFAPAGPSHAT